MLEKLLIEKVKEQECLFNTKHADYRDPNVRRIAWEEIGTELQITGAAAKETWDKLRRCFTNAINRQRDTKKRGSTARKKVVWKFENQMGFLLPFLETRKTHNNLSEIKNEVQNNIEQQPDYETSRLVQLSFDPEGADGSVVEGHKDPPQTAVDSDDSMETPSKKKRVDPSHNSSSEHQQSVGILKDSSTFREKRYELNDPSHGLDEVDLFFLSMSRMTKKLPKLEQARIKLQLSTMVLTAEMEDQQANHRYFDPKHSNHFAHPTQANQRKSPLPLAHH